MNLTYISNISEIGSKIETMEVLFTFGRDVTEKFIRGAENLSLIMVMSVGIEDLPARAIIYPVLTMLYRTKLTDQFFSRRQFKRMKNSTVFINVGRGNSMSEQDLLDVLNEGELAYAFLDVLKMNRCRITIRSGNTGK